MTKLRFFLLGALFAVGASAFAARPLIMGALPFQSCTAISNLALSTTSETVLASDTQRKAFCIGNSDASIAIHIAYHTTATTADIRLPPGSTLCENVEQNYIYTGVVDAIAASGTPAISGFSCK